MSGRANLLRSNEDADGDPDVEGCPGLAQIGRRKIDRYPPWREGQATVPDRSPYALPGLLEGGVRQADDRETRQPRRDVNLDPNEATVDSAKCG